MAEVTVYFLAPTGSLDLGAGIARLRSDGWTLTGKMYELVATEHHPVPLIGDQIPKSWESFTTSHDRMGVAGCMLRNGISVSLGTFVTNGVMSIALGWKPMAPPVPPEAIDHEFLLPLAERFGTWIVVALRTDPWWLPSKFHVDDGVLGIHLDGERSSELGESPPDRVFVHEIREGNVDAQAFRPVRRHGAWLACELDA